MMEVDDDTEIEEKKQEENMVENDTNMKNNKPQFLSQALTHFVDTSNRLYNLFYIYIYILRYSNFNEYGREQCCKSIFRWKL